MEETSGRNTRPKDAVMQKTKGRQETIFILKRPTLFRRVGGDSDNRAKTHEGKANNARNHVSEISDGRPGYYVGHKWIFFTW